MRYGLRWSGSLVALALLVSAGRADDAKPPDAEKLPKDQKEAREKVLTSGELLGKISRWEANEKAMTVEYEIAYAVPNVGELNQVARLQAELARAGTIRDPRDRAEPDLQRLLGTDASRERERRARDAERRPCLLARRQPREVGSGVGNDDGAFGRDAPADCHVS